MSAEFVLLNVLKSKTNWVRFRKHIKETAMSDVGWMMVQTIQSYYDCYPARTSIDWEEFEAYFFLIKNKHLSGDKGILARGLLGQIKDYDKSLLSSSTTEEILQDVLSEFIQLDYASRIVDVGMSIANNKAGIGLEDVGKLVNEWERETGKAVAKSDIFVSVDTAPLKETISGDGFEWRLHELNCSLGPLRLGDFVIVGARPESGKTTFAAQEATYMATQIKDKRPIVWVNNEERSKKVQLRCIQSHFAIDNKTLYDNLEKWVEQYKKDIGEKLLIIDDDENYNNVKRLDLLFEEYNPCMVVFDQLDKVEGWGKEERDDLRLGKLYKWARNVSKKYGPVIALSQVDGTGEGEKWIQMNQLRGSKTDKQGEADAIVTVGRVNDPHLEYQRFIHVPKNKLFGGPYSQEGLRHGYFEVSIKPSIGRYEGVMKK